MKPFPPCCPRLNPRKNTFHFLRISRDRWEDGLHRRNEHPPRQRACSETETSRSRFAFSPPRPGRAAVAGSVCKRLGVHHRRNSTDGPGHPEQTSWRTRSDPGRGGRAKLSGKTARLHRSLVLALPVICFLELTMTNQLPVLLQR